MFGRLEIVRIRHCGNRRLSELIFSDQPMLVVKSHQRIKNNSMFSLWPSLQFWILPIQCRRNLFWQFFSRLMYFKKSLFPLLFFFHFFSLSLPFEGRPFLSHFWRDENLPFPSSIQKASFCPFPVLSPCRKMTRFLVLLKNQFTASCTFTRTVQLAVCWNPDELHVLNDG